MDITVLLIMQLTAKTQLILQDAIHMSITTVSYTHLTLPTSSEV